jgi:alkylation response protein AidB-like acyl-CoA dehydrogenase
MNLELDADQRSVVEAVRQIFKRTAGTGRAREFAGTTAGMDQATLDALADSGYLDLAVDDGPADHLNAVLVIEQAEEFVVAAPVGARALVATHLGLTDLPTAIALSAGNGSTVRHGATAQLVLMLDGDSVRVLGPEDIEVEPVESRTAYPLATITARDGHGSLLEGKAGALTRAWRVLLAAEIAASMATAIEVARAHVAVRTQFGRPIGSFQAVQHRLAQAHVLAQGATWLARRAAWNLDDDLSAAIAAAYASAGVPEVFDAVHQVVGAVGFTKEFDLQLSSMRLPVLAAELGGSTAHATAVSRLKWKATT